MRRRNYLISLIFIFSFYHLASVGGGVVLNNRTVLYYETNKDTKEWGSKTNLTRCMKSSTLIVLQQNMASIRFRAHKVLLKMNPRYLIKQLNSFKKHSENNI